ncbi:hypothetical protein [Phytoactinopolyspora limicola]|nr:hypothetical protein [Phytoactinopolyspora limicola]
MDDYLVAALYGYHLPGSGDQEPDPELTEEVIDSAESMEESPAQSV